MTYIPFQWGESMLHHCLQILSKAPYHETIPVCHYIVVTFVSIEASTSANIGISFCSMMDYFLTDSSMPVKEAAPEAIIALTVWQMSGFGVKVTNRC